MRRANETRTSLRRRLLSRAGVVLVLASVLVADGGLTYTSAHSIVASRTTTIDLPVGGRLIVPPGAMLDGAKVWATRGDRPDGSHHGIRLLGQAVELVSDPPDAIRGVMTLELPVPGNEVPPNVEPEVWFGVSTFDPAAGTWQPRTATYDASRHMVVALIDHFSWWNPFSWNFDDLAAKVKQNFGELLGQRADPPRCSGGNPDWVQSSAGISVKDDSPVFACTQSDGDRLDVRLVNNRPYGQVVHLGPAVVRASHARPAGALGLVLAALVDATLDDRELYLPPLTSASIVINRMAPTEMATYSIGPSVFTVGADLALELLEPLDILGPIAQRLTKVPGIFKTCLTVPNGRDHLTDRQPGKLWDHALAVLKCVWDGLRNEAASLELPKEQLDRLAAAQALLKRANVALNGVELATDYLWKIGDLLSDWQTAQGTARGNGFEVRAKGAPAPPAPAPPARSRLPRWLCFIPPFHIACLL